MVRRSKLRHDIDYKLVQTLGPGEVLPELKIWERVNTKTHKCNVDCFLGSACVWPQCTCPVQRYDAPPVQSRGKRVYATPAGPYIPRRRRPTGWSPLSDWVVVRTKTGHENFASTQCRNQDMETWCPRYIKPGRGIPQPLFPGYLFVRPQGQWRQLRNTKGVMDIIMMGGKPDYVAKAAMKALRAMSDKDDIVTLPEQRPPQKGERVQMKVGAWQGFEGLYDGLDLDGRYSVLFSMFGKTVAIKFKRASSIEVTTP